MSKRTSSTVSNGAAIKEVGELYLQAVEGILTDHQ